MINACVFVESPLKFIAATHKNCLNEVLPVRGHNPHLLARARQLQILFKLELPTAEKEPCKRADFIQYPGFSLTPYLESFTPIFGLGTPIFQRISSKLHSGTPTFSQKCLRDSSFQNPSENPEYHKESVIMHIILTPNMPITTASDDSLEYCFIVSQRK